MNDRESTSRNKVAPNRDKFILEEWEIWFTYSTFFNKTIEELDAVAKRFVELGLADFVSHRDEEAVWRSTSGIQTGYTERMSAADGSFVALDVTTSDGNEPDFAPFAKATWLQSCDLRTGEIHLFGEDLNSPPTYIRAFLGPCILKFRNGTESPALVCYPIVKLYETGVVLVEFRITDPGHDVAVEKFITEYLQITRSIFTEIEIPPALAKISPLSSRSYLKPRQTVRERLSTLRAKTLHDLAVDQKTHSATLGNITFKMSPSPASLAGDSFETLSSLAQTIFGAVGYVASDPRRGLSMILRGQKELLEVGDFWYGHPHIHIIKHKGQMMTAAENAKRNGDFFGWIMSGVASQTENSRQYLPANSRTRNDYCAYIDLQATLWVWARKGLDMHKHTKGSDNWHLIYEPQACVEMLDYVYMLNRSLAEAAASANKYERAAKIRKNLLDITSRMRRSSQFGEVTDLLTAGWNSMGVRELQDEIAESLDISSDLSKLAEGRTAERIGLALTIVFGMLAVPTLASEVIGPIWHLLRIWRPSNLDAERLITTGVAAGLVGMIVWLVPYIFRHRKPPDS